MFKYTIDENNAKALNLTTLLLYALNHEYESVNVVTSVEMIRDYLMANEQIFIEHL